MEYLRIRNWDKFQQCDRNAPWIKLYTDLLHDYDFLNQNDSEKAALICIFLYAGAHGNKIPNDGKFLSSIFCLDSDVNIDSLTSKEWLEPFDEAYYLQSLEDRAVRIERRMESDRLRKRSKSKNKHSDSELQKSDSENGNSDLPETETEAEKEVEKEELPLSPPAPEPVKEKVFGTEWIMELWNSTCTDLPRCAKWTPTRHKNALARLKDHPDKSEWEAAFQSIHESAFCNGDNDKRWSARIDWVLERNTKDIIQGLIEGRYFGLGKQDGDDEYWPGKNDGCPRPRELTPQEQFEYGYKPRDEKDIAYYASQGVTWSMAWSRENRPQWHEEYPDDWTGPRDE